MRALRAELDEDLLAAPAAASAGATLDVLEAGGGRTFERYAAPVALADGQPIGWITVLHETTRERQAERAKAELVATVSHELRTPLAAILGYAELLLSRERDAETRTRYARTIHQEARRLSALIDDFLSLRTLEEGTLRLRAEPFALDELLEEQAELFSGQSAAHRIELALPAEPVVAVADRARVAQVLANLISNAIKYSPDGGVVELGAARCDGSVRVSVSDAGVGIPAGEQERVFERFFRAETRAARDVSGTGLGLALARGIVEAHGGDIAFESVEGRGSRFWFTVPAAPVASATDGAEAEKTAA